MFACFCAVAHMMKGDGCERCEVRLCLGDAQHMSSPRGHTEECAHRVIYSRSAPVFTATKGGRASSLRKHVEQCVFSAPILNSRSRGFRTAMCDGDDYGS